MFRGKFFDVGRQTCSWLQHHTILAYYFLLDLPVFTVTSYTGSIQRPSVAIFGIAARIDSGDVSCIEASGCPCGAGAKQFAYDDSSKPGLETYDPITDISVTAQAYVRV